MSLQMNWKKLNQASTDQAAVTDFALAYGATWSTAAQNPDNWPSAAKQVPYDAEAAIFMFAVADTAGDEVTAKIWGKAASGPPHLLVHLESIIAGTSVVSTDPATDASLTNFRYADDLTVGDDNTLGGVYLVEATNNGIAMIRFDLYGLAELYCDCDTDAGSGTAGTDLITYVRYME